MSPGSPELDLRYPLARTAVDAYAREGFVRLQGVLPEAALAHYGSAIDAEVARRNTLVKSLDERTTYEKAFLQVMNLWTTSTDVQRLVFSARLARIAADLLEVRGVRLYHDQALYKEPGGGATPWHADQYYWPLTTAKCLTAWIPLQESPLEMGPVAFSVGSHRVNVGRELPISDESEARISRSLLETKLPVHEAAFALGEVSFHSGWTFHRAGPNVTGRMRRVMTIIYIDAEMRIAAPVNQNQENDLATWFPGRKAGDLASSPLNPEIPLAP